MSDHFELPDYLPSKYKNWFDFYKQVMEDIESSGHPFNDDSVIGISEHYSEADLAGHPKTVFTQRFKLSVLKIRAFDFIYSKLPTVEFLWKIENALQTLHLITDSEDKDMLMGLFSIYKTKP